MIYEVGVVRNGQTDMLHYNRNTPKQAMEAGSWHGRVVFCRKVSRDKVLAIGAIEHMKLDARPVQVKSSPYRSAIAMDEMIGQKRKLRRKNLIKDKENS
jgi:hypothetical protein